MSVPVGSTPGASKPSEHYWLWVLCLLGLDYFSTLAYQPSITFATAGRLGPLATAVVALLTLFGAVPVYCYLAGKAPTGGSSIGLLAELVHGWRGKTLILILLGFAATDFIMLKTISLADAAVHILHSEHAGWAEPLHDFVAWLHGVAEQHLSEWAAKFFTEQLVATLILGVLGFVFWFVLRRGFNRNVLRVAVPLIALYLILNGVILVYGILYLIDHPGLVTDWLDKVHRGDWGLTHATWIGDGWIGVALLSILYLPNLALGLSGFEMSMILMPQVRGRVGEDTTRTRVRNTRKVLIAAALIMTVYLLASSLVTCILIPEAEFGEKGWAANRALAYLAHGGALNNVPDAPASQAEALPWCGREFGWLYDFATVMMLTLAGSSVMTVLATLLPKFLLRFGMEMRWTQRWGVLLMIFAGVNLAVTVYFRASVENQRHAYASGVLVLMSCASLVTYLKTRRTPGVGAWLASKYFAGVCAIFLAVTLAVAIRSGGGLLIAGLFILAIIAMSVLSRAVRANELRTLGFRFKDEQTKLLWDSLRMADFPVLVPHRPGKQERDLKESLIRSTHQLDPKADIVFLEVHTGDPSDFFQHPLVEVIREDTRFVIRLTHCVSVAHALAATALEMSRHSKPPGLHFGWPHENLLLASWNYFAFGEGNIPWKVRELIELAEPDPSKRPRVIVG